MTRCNVDKLIEWINSDIYSIVFTLITVLLSGVISLLISAVYFHVGNRNNLKMSVVYPIKRLLEEPCSTQNYKKLCSLSEEYSAKYFKKAEKKIILQMLEIYKEVSTYNEIWINADILFSYFEYTLKKNGIEPKVCPITDIDGNLIAYDYPLEVNYLVEDIVSVLEEQEKYFDPDECETSVIKLYRYYCENYYGANDIVFFSDYSYSQVLEMSKTKKKWDKTFDNMRKIKEKIFNLKIVCK